MHTSNYTQCYVITWSGCWVGDTVRIIPKSKSRIRSSKIGYISADSLLQIRVLSFSKVSLTTQTDRQTDRQTNTFTGPSHNRLSGGKRKKKLSSLTIAKTTSLLSYSRPPVSEAPAVATLPSRRLNYVHYNQTEVWILDCVTQRPSESVARWVTQR